MNRIVRIDHVIGDISPDTVHHDRAILERLGFAYGDPSNIVTAPEGWSFEAVNNCTYTIRNGEVVRGEVWRSSAPDAFWRFEFLRRHKITDEQPTHFDGYLWYKSAVEDRLTGEVISPVFSCYALDMQSLDPEASRKRQKAVNDAHTWLMEHYPETHDPTAYWDD